MMHLSCRTITQLACPPTVIQDTQSNFFPQWRRQILTVRRISRERSFLRFLFSIAFSLSVPLRRIVVCITHAEFSIIRATHSFKPCQYLTSVQIPAHAPVPQLISRRTGRLHLTFRRVHGRTHSGNILWRYPVSFLTPQHVTPQRELVRFCGTLILSDSLGCTGRLRRPQASVSRQPSLLMRCSQELHVPNKNGCTEVNLTAVFVELCDNQSQVLGLLGRAARASIVGT